MSRHLRVHEHTMLLNEKSSLVKFHRKNIRSERFPLILRQQGISCVLLFLRHGDEHSPVCDVSNHKIFRDATSLSQPTCCANLKKKHVSLMGAHFTQNRIIHL